MNRASTKFIAGPAIIVADAGHGVPDILSAGYIARVDEPALRGRTPTAIVYAELGLWYDALESLSDAVAAAPDNSELRAQLNSLLRQVDLDAAIE